MEFKLNLYSLRENRPMKAETFSQLISTSLYEKRYPITSIFPKKFYKDGVLILFLRFLQLSIPKEMAMYLPMIL